MKSQKVKNLIKQFHGLSKPEQIEFTEFLYYDLEILVKKPKDKVPSFDFKIGLPQTKQRSNTMLDLTITDEQKVQVTITPVTATGKPAKLDGAPTWTVQSGESTVSVAPDGLSAFLISADNADETLILVEADADLGAGVTTISDSIQLHVQGAQASSLGLTAAAPVPKP